MLYFISTIAAFLIGGYANAFALAPCHSFEQSVVMKEGSPKPIGTVISHIPKSTGKYIGSPSLCILPDWHLSGEP